MLFLKTILVFIHFVTIQTTNCVCTTVTCPDEGHNKIIMGNGGAIIDYIYSSHNNHEVVVSASGIVAPSSLDHGSGTTSCTQKYSRMLEDDGEQDCDAGHILANRLGGYGNIPTNIFPQNAAINRGVYSQFEGYIYDYITNNNINGTLSWNFFYYNESHTMPYAVNYSALFQDGYMIQSLFKN